MKRESSDGSVVNPEHLDRLRRPHVPDSDGGVVRCRDDNLVASVVHNAVHPLGVTLEDCDHL